MSAPGLTADYALVRVDDRLLHGQVVFGWGQALFPRTYLIVDDQVATDPWEREAFQLAAPEEVGVRILACEEFLRAPDAEDPGGTVLLLRDLTTLRRLVAAGFRPPGGVNLGGIHAREGSHEFLSYLHLMPAEVGVLKEFLTAGYPVYAQDLPTSSRHDASQLWAMIGG